MRVKHNILVQVARDTAMKNHLFFPDSTLNEVVIDAFQKSTNGDLAVDVSQVQELLFGDITTVRGMYLEIDQDVLLKLNDDDVGVRLHVAEGAVNARFFLEGVITRARIDNDSGEAATGIFLFWGDPTP